jgi:hypothetical protein
MKDFGRKGRCLTKTTRLKAIRRAIAHLERPRLRCGFAERKKEAKKERQKVSCCSLRYGGLSRARAALAAALIYKKHTNASPKIKQLSLTDSLDYYFTQLDLEGTIHLLRKGDILTCYEQLKKTAAKITPRAGWLLIEKIAHELNVGHLLNLRFSRLKKRQKGLTRIYAC